MMTLMHDSLQGHIDRVLKALSALARDPDKEAEFHALARETLQTAFTAFASEVALARTQAFEVALRDALGVRAEGAESGADLVKRCRARLLEADNADRVVEACHRRLSELERVELHLQHLESKVEAFRTAFRDLIAQDEVTQ